MAINKNLLHMELEAAGLPVLTVRDGEPLVDYSRSLSGAEQTTADAVIAAHDPEAASKMIQQLIGMAQTAVGVTLGNLTVAQRSALTACLLYLAGGLDVKTGTVKPLGQWLR